MRRPLVTRNCCACLCSFSTTATATVEAKATARRPAASGSTTHASENLFGTTFLTTPDSNNHFRTTFSEPLPDRLFNYSGFLQPLELTSRPLRNDSTATPQRPPLIFPRLTFFIKKCQKKNRNKQNTETQKRKTLRKVKKRRPRESTLPLTRKTAPAPTSSATPRQQVQMRPRGRVSDSGRLRIRPASPSNGQRIF